MPGRPQPQPAPPQQDVPEALLRASLWFEERVPVRSLQGYDRRYHRLPDRVDGDGDRFAAAVGRDDLEERLESIRSALRRQFRYRRRELERCEQHLITPDFEYGLELGLDAERQSPATALFRGEVTNIRGRGMDRVLTPAFATVFGGPSGFSVRHEADADLEALIDAIEEQDQDLQIGGRLLTIEYPEDCSELLLELPPGFQAGVAPATLRFSPRAVEVRIPGAPSARELIETFAGVATQLADVGIDILPRRP